MKAKIPIPQRAIAAFCRRWKIVEFSVFGSVLRDDFGPDSDVDVLVRFALNAKHTLFHLAHIQGELRHLLGREVDLVESSAIEKSRNYLRRRAILETAEIVYEACETSERQSTM